MIENVNCIQLSFGMLTSSTIILGSLLHTFEKYLPTFVRQTFRYGKFSCKEKCFVNNFEVPKSTFRQFYRVGVTFSTPCLLLVTLVYLFDFNVPNWIVRFLDSLCGGSRFVSSTPVHIFIAIILLTLQCYRRFYDTHFVSIFNKNGNINVLHYLVGLFFYPACFLAILCEAPKFTILSRKTTIEITDLSYMDLLAISVFLWAWWHQHIASVILANLRRDSEGNVATEEHKLPYGDWFHYLFCPHQTAEILMYLALTVILRCNKTWTFAFAFVLSNQVETSLLSHQWYKENFDKFPEDRKAVIPFIY